MAKTKAETPEAENEEEGYEIVVTPDEQESGGTEEKSQTTGSEEDGDETEAEEYSRKVQKRIDTLVRKQKEAQEAYDAAMQEKMTVEEFARRALEENKQLRARLDTTTDTAYEAFGRSIDAEIAAAKAAYVKAHEEGDGMGMADAQAKLAEMAARKAQISNRPKRKPQEQQQEPSWEPPKSRQQQPQPAKVSETTRDWASRNTWFQAPGKERMTGMAMILHQEAVQSGMEVESEDYFAYIDENMRKTFPEEFASQGASKSQASQPKVAGAARSGGRKRVDSITESEAALCKRMGISEKDYLEQKRKLS